jgi:lipopolysaccharide/colanic/teichoic acid biosynthesis glycosyltransferase
MLRRALDLIVAISALVLLAPFLAIILFLIWCQDRHSPFYIAPRAGLGGSPFKMIKIRSMVVNADRSGVESTSANDSRITPLGHFVRRWKIDELSQLWNVFCGDMSLVGPRPNTLKEVETYSKEERKLLSVRPGITDFSSIVFSDEGEILKNSLDPDTDYTYLIRPWKSELGLLYVRHASTGLNVRLIWLTLMAIVDKRRALNKLDALLSDLGCDNDLREVARRRQPLADFADRASKRLSYARAR